ncbi:MAG: metal-dependent hydrolase [Clostridiaceae bacterium]|nr:metal-dependent hydrolase [Clostridiaceae bacterium]
MTGKTHMSVGLAASSLLLKHPKSRVEFGIFLGFAVIGALMPDVDQKQSTLGHFINVVMISILIGLIALKVIGIVPQYSSYIQNSILLKSLFQAVTADILGMSNFFTIIGCVLIIINIIVARITGHRKFAHSFLGFISFSVGIFLLFGMLVLKPFVIGYISHLAIDLLNYKEEKLFFPSKFGVCLNLVRTGGAIDHALGFCAVAVFLALNLS